MKRVVVPAATPDDVEASIQLDAEQYIPFDITEVNLDYQVVGPGITASEEAGMEVVLVAAKKDKIQNHTNVITLAGKDAEVVDIDAFALQNVFEANYSVDPKATVALLNIGASLMNINITKGGMPLFIRDVSVGGNQYTDILQKELQLNFQEAEDLKLGKTGWFRSRNGGAVAGIDHRYADHGSSEDLRLLPGNLSDRDDQPGFDQRRHVAHVGIGRSHSGDILVSDTGVGSVQVHFGRTESRFEKSDVPRTGAGRCRWVGLKGVQ